MKRCFIKHLLAAAALLSASAARADWFSYDGLYYDTLDETTCEVSDNKWHSGTASIPEQVTNPLDGKVCFLRSKGFDRSAYTKDCDCNLRQCVLRQRRGMDND